jgi:methylmalonyl-CoA/ethylmalonyl-CoA epimerase
MSTKPDGVEGLRAAGAPHVKGIEHLAVAAPSLDEALRFWRDVLGWRLVSIERVDEQQVDTARLELGPHCIELVCPLAPDSPVGRFLAKRGPGLHHVCLEVDDVAAVLPKLDAAGVELIDRVPKRGAHGCLVAFVHPRATGGVLVELSHKPGP